MLRNQIAPLRTNAGNAIEISNVQIVDRSSSVFNTSILNIMKINSYSQSEEFDYSRFLPDPIELAKNLEFSPINGAAKLKTPLLRDIGFSRDTNAIFTAILLEPSTGIKSRDLFIEIEVSFTEKKLVGGICYFGFPSLPYYITPQGENSANFGLPREIKISWENESSQFIDDESSMLIQEPVSHSGVHFLGIDPVKTDKIKLRFSDWPEFITRIEVIEGRELNTEIAYGLLLPSLMFYEHKESSRYKPHVPLGILACKKIKHPDNREIPSGRSAPDIKSILETITSKLNADYIYFVNEPEKVYFNYSAASITGQKRKIMSNYIENFVSSPLKFKDSIQLYIEQVEENDRCIAGVKIKFATAPTIPGQVSNPSMEIKIYEIDFPEGVSPISPGKNPDTDKYFTLIYSGKVTSSSAEHICRFLRSSLSRYFLINFQNTSQNTFTPQNTYDKTSQLRIDTLELIQSAHVAVTPRASKIQRIDSINFRLIGENLADDYSKLGDEGFSIAVESINAGQRRDLLFSADNLLTLLNSGTAKIFSNYRREEITGDVSEEKITTHAGSKDIHSTSVDSKGWRKNETGKGVDWTREGLTDDEFSQSTNLLGEFDSFGTSEIRTHNEQLGFEVAGDMFHNFSEFLEFIYGNNINNFPRSLQRLYEANPLRSPLLWAEDENGYDWENKIWIRGLDNPDTAKDNFYVGIMNNLTLPPFIPPSIGPARESLQGVLTFIKNVMNTRDLRLPEGGGPDINNLISLLIPTAPAANPILWPLVNGLSVGINVGASCFVGGGMSLSTQQILPSLSYNSADGTTGSIARQASKTGYNYSQILNLMYDKSRVISVFEESEMKRKVERLLNPIKERTRGVEVMWQDKYVDIITGKIPLGITLPATAKNYYEGIDQSIRVRFGGKIGQGGVEVDVWFDVLEETIKEDY
ncbi:Uncharacterised protein [uncultured archaeon]|nr:Uncharacterised protein [uncultured archaeon]